MMGLGDVARDLGDTAGIRRYCVPSLQLTRELGMSWAIGYSLNNLAMADLLDGKSEDALKTAESSVELFQSLQAQGGVAEVLITIGRILRVRGDRAGSFTSLTQALDLAWDIGPRILMASALEALAQLADPRSHAELSVRLSAAAAALRASMGTPIVPAQRAAMEQVLERARTRMGTANYTAIWAEASA